MRRVKKFAALLLCGTMTISALAGCGGTDGGAKDDSGSAPESSPAESSDGSEESSAQEDGSEDTGNAEGESAGGSDYAETISFSMTSYNTIAGTDYTSDDFYKYVADRFNVDMDIWANEPNAADEKFRLWISGDGLPDAAIWEGINYVEYYDYINQGLLQPLPEGWETRWPDINRMIEATGEKELLTVDGRIYAIPHGVYGNYLEMDPVISHISLVYRQDWAKEVGMENLGADYTISESELKEYLQKVKAAGLTNDGAYVSTAIGTMVWMFRNLYGIMNNSFYEGEDGFIWTPLGQREQWIKLITTMREWYKEGLIDPDFAVVNDAYDARASMMSGTLAAFYDTGVAGGLASYRDGYVKSSADHEYEDIGVAHVIADDGTSWISAVSNSWTAHVFSPKTDAKTLERILDVMNWFAGKEGSAAAQLGIPEVDWEYDAEGNPRYIQTTEYPSRAPLALLGWCGDDFGYTGAVESIKQCDIDDTRAVFEAKDKGNIVPVQINYANYSSNAKDIYSVDVGSKVAELAVNNDDIEAAWDAFIEENRGMWEPLLNELNEYYGYTD